MKQLIFNSLFLIIFIIYQTGILSLEPNTVTNKFIRQTIETDNKVFNSVVIDEPHKVAYFYKNSTLTYKTKISNNNNYEDKLKNYYNGTDYFNNIDIVYESSKSIFSRCFDYFVTFFIVHTILSFIKLLFVRSTSNNKSDFSISSLVFPENGFTINKNVEARFNDVIGLKSVKQDLEQYVDMIVNRDKYCESGAKLPKGLLFTGPPGTGKTLLAKCLAGETGTSFISVSGSDFIEVFAGVGAQRVRNLFKLARKYSPCIIFIDEIDAIGRKRSGQGHGGHNEQGQTINKLLCEMDGFTENDNIMIIAATNMKNVLDNALTRSGRFDRNIVFDLPNINERKDLFKLYLEKIKLDKSMKDDYDDSCQKLARMTGGLSGADIANISNQAIISHLKKEENKNEGANFNDIEQAIDEVMIGMKKIERLMTNEERETVAHHEAGHALVAYLLKHTNPPVKVSIVPRGDAALGFSQQESIDKKLYTKEELNDKICVCLGGRIAEEVMFGKITTGASDDIEKLTHIVYNMVCVYGMSDTIGTIYHKSDDMSDKRMSKIDDEVSTIIQICNNRTKTILAKHKNELIKIAQHLLDTELLLGYEIKDLIDKDGSLENSISF